MVTTQDASIGLVAETTYKTGVTVTRFPEFTDESLGWDKSIKQGAGLRVGGRVARSGRRVMTTGSGSGDFTVECGSKGQGLLWEAALGSGVATVVSGATYQHLFTLADTPKSYTVQKGLPEVGGTVDAYTLLGAMVDQWEFNLPNDDIATLKLTWDVGDITTATAYAAPSYVTGLNLFHFAQASISTGTLTSPTTTALGSAVTPMTNIRSFSVQGNNNLAKDRFNAGGAGRKSKPTVGLREITGSITAEYDSTTLRDAYLNETAICLVLTLTGSALSTGNETLQIVLPEVKLDGQLPVTNGTDLITTDYSFTVLDNLTATQPIWVVTRTADTTV